MSVSIYLISLLFFKNVTKIRKILVNHLLGTQSIVSEPFPTFSPQWIHLHCTCHLSSLKPETKGTEHECCSASLFSGATVFCPWWPQLERLIAHWPWLVWNPFGRMDLYVLIDRNCRNRWRSWLQGICLLLPKMFLLLPAWFPKSGGGQKVLVTHSF